MSFIPDWESTLGLFLLWVGIPGGVVGGALGLLHLLGWVDLGQKVVSWGREASYRASERVESGLAHPIAGMLATLVVAVPTVVLWAIASQIICALFGLVPGASISPPGLDLSVWPALVAPQSVTMATQWVVGATAISSVVLALSRAVSKDGPGIVLAVVWTVPWFLLTVLGSVGLLLTVIVALIAWGSGGSGVGVEHVLGWLTLSLTLYIAGGAGLGLLKVAVPDFD